MKILREKRRRAIFFASALFSLGILFSPPLSFAANPSSTLPQTKDDLQNLIQARAQQLEAINRQLETTQVNLNTVKTQGATLQRQLSVFQSNINQLDLNIKSDEITSQKLVLEISSTQYDIQSIEGSIAEKKDAVVHLLQELQKNDRTNLLAIVLKNQTLAQSYLETQSLSDIRTQLAADIVSLADFKKELDGKLQDVGTKKIQIELHQKNLSSRKAIVKDQQQEQKAVLAQTKNKESLYEQQLADLKAQQNSISDEIAKIEDQLRSSFDASILPMKRAGVFAWPVEHPMITQHFGEKSYLYRGKPHNGLDLGAPIGTPVFAADDGVVMAVDNNDRTRWNKYQYGKYILIRHNNNLATLYGHLSAQVVQTGQQVARGKLIGYSGSTGYATGPHLHFGVYWAPSILMKSIPPAAGLVPVGVVINPEDYL